MERQARQGYVTNCLVNSRQPYRRQAAIWFASENSLLVEAILEAVRAKTSGPLAVSPTQNGLTLSRTYCSHFLKTQLLHSNVYIHCRSDLRKKSLEASLIT